MANTTMPLTTKISQGSEFASQSNILKSKFGDGYEQRVPNGINYKRDKISLVWENVTLAEKTTILAALELARWGSDYLTYTIPGDASAKRFIQDGDWSYTIKSGTLYDVTVPFVQVFDL
jgi:phage-related protein